MNNVVQTSRNVADGKFYLNNKGKLIAGKHPKYITSNFIKQNNNYISQHPSEGKIIEEGQRLHEVTADNTHAYFDGKVWVWVKNKSNNPRYTRAITESKKYLKRFAQNKTTKYKLKY